MTEPILVAQAENAGAFLLPDRANRHGLVTGATGTGKTVTLQTLAEGFSRIGVPVFAADIKGDLTGISQPGGGNEKVQERIELLGLAESFEYAGSPVTLWDVFGEQGHPLRATISEMGPLLMSRILQLNDTQSAIMSVCFKIADDEGLMLLDLKDLRAMLQYVGENRKELGSQYGNISVASVGAIQRGMIELETQGAEKFFGEPAVQLADFMQTVSGRGVVNILAADKLFHSPKLYSTFLLWLLSELFEMLPEVGDVEKPKMVFFFDEAHLLFDDAPPALVDKIEQVVRLIRSKGVGIFFVTQNPVDIPDKVLSQLGNRVQHALRAYTPREQKAVRAAAETFRENPEIDTETAITQLGVGEALVSFLDGKGTPSIVERALIVPPHGQLGPITQQQRREILSQSLVGIHYENEIDRESAYEILKAKGEAASRVQEELKSRPKKKTSRSSRSDSPMEAFTKSAARAVGSQVGRQLIRGVLGGLLGTQTRRRKKWF